MPAITAEDKMPMVELTKAKLRADVHAKMMFACEHYGCSVGHLLTQTFQGYVADDDKFSVAWEEQKKNLKLPEKKVRKERSGTKAKRAEA